jgi:hypothetical protein
MTRSNHVHRTLGTQQVHTTTRAPPPCTLQPKILRVPHDCRKHTVQLFVKRVLFRRLFGNGGGDESGFGAPVVVDGELAAGVNAPGTRRFRNVVQRQATVKDRPRVGINLPTMLQQMLARRRSVQPRVFGQKRPAFGKGLVDARFQLDLPRHFSVLGNGLVTFLVADKVTGHGAFFHANPVKINRGRVDFGTFAGGLLGHFKHVFGQARVDGAVVVGVHTLAADFALVVGLWGWWRKGGGLNK